MELQNLKKEIPFKWRVQSSNQYGASCVAYIDARQVQDLLDEVCGAENWQVKYEEHKGNLFASIGIFVINRDSYGWAWKSDCGTESNVEKEKGEASDSFKRAAVMWGIGRFLYSKKIVKLPVKKGDNGKWTPYDFNKNKFIYDVTPYCNNELNAGVSNNNTSDNLKWLNPNTNEWTNAVAKKVSLDKVKQHYKISKENEVLYLKEIA